MNRIQSVAWAMVSLAILSATPSARGADTPKKIGYRDTPMLPGGRWHVHDSERPQPPIVTPGSVNPASQPVRPPSDAVVLFDGQDLNQWQGVKEGAAPWKIERGFMEVLPTSGDIQTKAQFGDCQLHVEWATPDPPRGDIMNRGNSGIFLFGLYEVQVFESHPEQGGIYADGQAGAVYGQYPPLVNACRRPGEWQVFDILFTAPRFRGDQLEAPAYLTLLHNGVLVQNHTALLGPTGHRSFPKYVPHGPNGPIRLQAHGNPVRFRNIWIRELKAADAP